jgi:arylsulfatase A-like enzyme
LHVSGQEIPANLDGEVLPTFRTEPADPDRTIYVVEGKENWKFGPLKKATIALVKDRYKLVRYSGYKGLRQEIELFDLADDPEEMHNLGLERQDVAGRLLEELSDKLGSIPYGVS